MPQLRGPHGPCPMRAWQPPAAGHVQAWVLHQAVQRRTETPQEPAPRPAPGP